jgi:hypothetical protein
MSGSKKTSNVPGYIAGLVTMFILSFLMTGALRWRELAIGSFLVALYFIFERGRRIREQAGTTPAAPDITSPE